MNKPSTNDFKFIDLIHSVRRRPKLYIGDISGFHSNTRGFLNLLYLLLNKLQTTEENICFHLNIEAENEFCIRVEQADHLIKFVDPSTSIIDWADHSILFLMAFTKQSLITITKEGCLYEVEHKNDDYHIITSNTETEGENNRIEIRFNLDTQLFDNTCFNLQLIREELTQYAMLAPCMKIFFKHKPLDTRELFFYPRGISEKLEVEFGKQTTTSALFTFDQQVNVNNYAYHIAFCYSDNWTGRTYIKTFVDHYYLYRGGSLEEGVIAGIQQVLQERMDSDVNITTNQVKKGLVLVAQVKALSSESHYRFTNAVIAQLDMPKMERDVANYVKHELNEKLNKNPDIAKQLLKLIEDRI